MRSCRYTDYQSGNNHTGIEYPRRQNRIRTQAESPPPPIMNQDDNQPSSSVNIPDTKNLLDSMPAAVVVVDRFGYVSYFNNRATEYLGSLKTGDQWRKIIECRFRDACGNDEVITTRGYMLSLDTQPMPDKKGQMIVFHDVGRTAELKRTRERYARLAELGELSARMAHQIRTPLAASMLFLSNIKNSLDSSSREYKNLIKGIQGLRNIEAMIADMLLFSSDKNGHGKNLNIKDLLYALEHDSEVLKQQYRCDIAFKYSDELSGISGNLYAVKSAISNIIENSAQACMTKKIHYENKGEEYSGKIDVMIFACDEEDYSIYIKVSDNATGIPEKHLKDILKPFYTTKQNGTGLGLAVVKSVVDAHGGTLQISSNMGSGTETIIRLP